MKRGHSRRPALEGGDGEESHHAHQDVVEVEVTVVPQSFLHHGLGHIAVLVHNKGAPEGHSTHTPTCLNTPL